MAPELTGSANRKEGWRMDLSQAPPKFQGTRSPPDSLGAHVRPGVLGAGTQGQVRDSARRLARTLPPAAQVDTSCSMIYWKDVHF